MLVYNELKAGEEFEIVGLLNVRLKKINENSAEVIGGEYWVRMLPLCEVTQEKQSK